MYELIFGAFSLDTIEGIKRAAIPLNEIEDILRIRKPLYDGFASFRIIIDHKTIDEIVNEIMKLLGKEKK